MADNDGLVGREIFVELKQAGYEYLFGEQDSPKLPMLAKSMNILLVTSPVMCFSSERRREGIAANQRYPADLMRDNLLVNCHVIESAHRHGVQKLLYLASSCVYPKFSEQPMKVEYLTTGKLEPTNEPYAIAKLAGLFLCGAYRRQFGTQMITAIPANVFGPGEDFSPERLVQ